MGVAIGTDPEATIMFLNSSERPLAVKLGTLTFDLEGADVHSYAEDNAVEHRFLSQHLAHFGIGFSSLRKDNKISYVLRLFGASRAGICVGSWLGSKKAWYVSQLATNRNSF